MNAVVGWVGDLLVAAWRRQEAEGRYRGGDDFRALHIDPKDALASWRAATAPTVPWPKELMAEFPGVQADLLPSLASTPEDALVAALAVSVELEQRLRPLVAALTDDPALRLPTRGLACELGEAVGLTAADVRNALAPDGRLAFCDLVRTVRVEGRPSRLDEALVASDWLVARVAGAPVTEPRRLRWVGERSSGERTRRGPARLVLVSGADHLRHAERLARTSGTVALLRDDALDEATLRATVRAASARDATVLVGLSNTPEPWMLRDLETAAALGCPMALSLPASVDWVAPASWTVVRTDPARVDERRARWEHELADRGVQADRSTVDAVAAEFRLGDDAVADAAERVASMGAAEPVTLPELRSAARRTVWRDLSSCARRGPTGNSWSDLVVTAPVRRQLQDVAAAIVQRERVLDEWGFGDRPGSRGYHVLFAGPSGTGKTMSAGVIAEEAGLELWVVDLARVVDKYLGETEKALDRVLRAAEGSGAMLLFDEADALFGRRGEVREAKDRWANVEVAFLLQRIEDHDGVTVLTTNVSHHLDDAFARRMSQRVEFGIPDAALRLLLWQRSLPGRAPLADASALATVADRFELAGGAIRTAALNAAYEAAAADGLIGLPHLVRATVRELTKAGRPPTRSDLAELADHLAVTP